MTENFSDHPIEKNSPESWEYARNYAALFGDIPASFASTMRSLIADHEKRGGVLSSSSRFMALRLLRGRNLKAPYYFASLTYKESELSNVTTLSDDDLLKLFKPLDTAALFGLIYLYKKAKKLCDPTEWSFIHESLMKETDIAGLLGLAVPGIGLASSLFASTLRHLALATFLRFNPKHFQEYRRGIKAEKTLFRIDQQMNYWGCTDLQVASIFLQSLGFGVNYANSFAMALSSENLLTKTERTNSPFKVSELWIKCLLDTGAEPKIIHDSSFYPKQAELFKLIENINVIRQSGSKYKWLDKGTDDISPSLTPQLFSQASTPSTAVVADFEQLPEDVKENLSKEEWEKSGSDEDI